MVNKWVIAILTAYLLLAWFIGSWLHLAGSNLWLLRGGLWLLGLLGAGLFFWWYYKVLRPGTGNEQEQGAAGDEMDALIRDALRRIHSSKQVDFKRLPFLYILGPTGSTKTTIIANSGLDPELIAGQVYRDQAIAPTQSVNLWFTRQALFVDAGGGLLNQPWRWKRLIRRLRPGRLASTVGKGAQAPRAAVVAFDCETFLQPGASDALPAAARNLNARLQELSQELGINLPLYVLFTKLDRISFFADYVRNLNGEEAGQVFGATLPLRSLQPSGLYADQETRRLDKAFDDLFYSLAEKRLEFLAREADPQNLAGVYEFPREWRKLRSGLVQFLVELGRPSQLRAGPVLRGFYFCGVRAIMVDDMARAAPAAVSQSPEVDAGATRMFSVAPGRGVAQAVAPARVPVQKKVPQWVFLAHLFHDIVLKDRSALGLSQRSTKVSALRRMLLAGAAAVCLLLALAWLISFVANRSLQAEVSKLGVESSVRQLEGQFPGPGELQRLEALRQEVELLQRYQREGAPWHMRWGLYVGDSMLGDVRRIYFARFYQMIFASAEQAMVRQLQKLPIVPGPDDNYSFTYDTLKAYLITTSNHDKSTTQFLPPVLMSRYLAGRELDPERSALVRNQFDFYAGELAIENPYSSASDTPAVEHARGYLAKFGAVERIYRSMLDAADHKNQSLRFRTLFPGSENAVVDNKEIEGAFTKNGFVMMQDAIAHSDRFFAGEQWVLGSQSYGSLDRPALEQEIRTRYQNDFIAQWREFLRAAAVLRYAGAGDAARKLMLLSGNASPLLALLSLVSTHTAVDNPEIAGAFQPVQAVVLPNAVLFVNQANQGYMNGLIALQGAMDQWAKSPGGLNDKPTVDQVRSTAMTARQSALQLQQTFRVDQVGRVDAVTADLLTAPIRNAEAILAASGPAQLNGAGKALCAQFSPVTGKFPFNPQSKTQATFAEVNALFQPGTGALWTFYEQNFKNLVVRQGTNFVVNPSGGVKITPAFLGFFNRAVQFSEAVYAGNSPQPQLRFTLRPYPVTGIEALTFDMNGQTLPTPGPAKQFTWTGGDMGEVRVTGKMGGAELGILSYSGTWALFQFFSEADRWETAGNTHTVEWVPKSGLSAQPMMVGGKPLTLRYDLEMAGAPVFNRAFLAGLRCTANVAGR